MVAPRPSTAACHVTEVSPGVFVKIFVNCSVPAPSHPSSIASAAGVSSGLAVAGVDTDSSATNVTAGSD
jgi:hypothetical protein